MTIKILSMILPVVALAVACFQVGQIRATSRRIEAISRRYRDLGKRVNQ